METLQDDAICFWKSAGIKYFSEAVISSNVNLMQ